MMQSRPTLRGAHAARVPAIVPAMLCVGSHRLVRRRIHRAPVPAAPEGGSGLPRHDEVSMNQLRLAPPMAYGLAVLAVLGSLLVRLPLVPWLGDHAELMTFLPAVIPGAYLGGLGPGLLATVLSVVAADYFFIEPRYSFGTGDPGRAFAMGLFAIAGAVISGLMESVDRSRRRLTASERRYAVTLASIGDAIIATDVQAQVTLMNSVAEALTGWPLVDAVGRLLGEVFCIINKQTRHPVEDPPAQVLRLGTVVGLAKTTQRSSPGTAARCPSTTAAPLSSTTAAPSRASSWCSAT